MPHRDPQALRGLLLADSLGLSPFLQQHLAAAGVACLGHGDRDDAVGAEVAKALTLLAPGGDHPGAVEEAEREGPDGPRGLTRVAVAIGDPELALAADGEANGRELVIADR